MTVSPYLDSRTFWEKKVPTGLPRKEAELEKCPPTTVLLPSILKKWLVSTLETHPLPVDVGEDTSSCGGCVQAPVPHLLLFISFSSSSWFLQLFF